MGICLSDNKSIDRFLYNSPGWYSVFSAIKPVGGHISHMRLGWWSVRVTLLSVNVIIDIYTLASTLSTMQGQINVGPPARILQYFFT